MEGYCGKSCVACDWREQLDCPGCQEGPGRVFGGGCGVAACCREKGHQACGTCTHLTGCPQRAGRDRAPEERIRRAEAADQRRRELDRRAPLLGKWLWVLFWLFIPNEIGTLMSSDRVMAAFPLMGMAGELLLLLCGLAYAVILWRLRKTGERYCTAAVCQGISAVAAVCLAAVDARDTEGGLTFLVTLPVLTAALLATYQEFNAHAEVLDGVDDTLAEKWRKLWKWHIGLLIGVFACILIAGLLGAVVMLAGAIGVAVVSVLKLVYLYRTAKLFREYIPFEKEALPE